MNTYEHGGNLLALSEQSGKSPESLLDFSVNIHPEGVPDFIRAALNLATTKLHAYPSPHAEEAMQAASLYYQLPKDFFVFGNGSNELIHALPRLLKKKGVKEAVIIEPAFSEYALACHHADLPIKPIWGGLKEQTKKNEDKDILENTLKDIAPHSAIFLANPENPSGHAYDTLALFALIKKRPDLVWIIDEAFIDYVGDENTHSLISLFAKEEHKEFLQNTFVLRSLTKFYGLPGLRVGFLVAQPSWANALRQSLPSWSVNAFAIQAAIALFSKAGDFAKNTREKNTKNRKDLVDRLSTLPKVHLYPSSANYVLFSLNDAPKDLPFRLVKEYGIVIRDCANYYGLEKKENDNKTFYRVAVRLPHEHQILLEALQELLGNKASQETRIRQTTKKQKIPALMLQGTGSSTGKSVLTAAFCRIFQQDGYNIAPFKAQNMSSNSAILPNKEEMGHAQIIQARAAHLDADSRMNPILLKPSSDTGSEIICLGKSLGHMQARDYFNKKHKLWQTVTDAYDSLSEGKDIMVLEGAGSPAEVNLRSHDIVNMRMALYAKAKVILIGDIDRGGVYASFLGTWMTFSKAERDLMLGFLVNRFRGDQSFLKGAHTYIQGHTALPVLGVIPYVHDIGLPEEDSFTLGKKGPKFDETALHEVDKALDRLAAIVREAVDLKKLYNHLGF